MTNTLLLLGSLSVCWLCTIMLWSIVVPSRRLWPVGHMTPVKTVLLWVPFLLLFGSVLGLGALDWNSLGWNKTLRWGVGLPLFVIGHVIAYSGAFKLGYKSVSGEKDILQVDGFYRYSRNPQYTADIAIMVGWIIFSASLYALPLALATILLLILAPFSEEPWLRQVYGKPYIDYCKRVRRFL